MSDKHTTLPWYAESTSVDEMYEVKYDGRSLATAFSNPYIPSNAKQDAEFIVTACNNHEALVEALRAILPMAKGYAYKNNVGNNIEKCQEAGELLEQIGE